ncbi:Hypothetical predicted protein [Mytilus galloprovincialis]|uniref:G-protein coupled receptors family 1 profile domain-containing protein n=2 Tax=Mytilus galloprovincialis TaxID=29158 RepID=A0A8B6GGN4_MYTGA|nr:Hypothetical predicted protein [Mytilus galloprovincialis]
MDPDGFQYFDDMNQSSFIQYEYGYNFTTDLYTKDVNDYQTVVHKFAIVFAVLVAAIIFSNLLVIILIILKKLRKDVFYWKVIILSVGDLIGCTTLPFSYIMPDDDWWKSDTTCIMVLNMTLVYYLFSGLALVALCLDFPVNLFSTYFRLRRIFHRTIHGLFMILPFFLTYVVALPIVIQYGTNVKVVESMCVETMMTTDESYTHPSIPVQTLAAVVSIPALIIMIASVVIHKRLSKHVNITAPLNRINPSTDLENLNSCGMPEKEISDQRCEHIVVESESVFSFASENEILSSTYAVIAITTFSILCHVPLVAWVNRTEKKALLSFDEYIQSYMITNYVITTISLIPAAVRSYMWMIDTNVRKAVFATLNRCGIIL